MSEAIVHSQDSVGIIDLFLSFPVHVDRCDVAAAWSRHRVTT